MSTQIIKDPEVLHPILQEAIKIIQVDVIAKHNMPFRVFEMGRSAERHQYLISKGKTQDLLSRHLYNFSGDVPLYASAVDFVLYETRWSWNLRDSTVSSWYLLFGNLVLDRCPELEWCGYNRKATNYTHFELKQSVMIDNLDTIPCVVR